MEDNRVNQQVVTVNLKKLGLKYKIANNGAEAIELYKAHHEEFSLILMDCMMPVMDGFRVAECIRASEMAWAHRVKKNRQLAVKAEYECKIIAVTAMTITDNYERRAEKCGINDTLRKPVN